MTREIPLTRGYVALVDDQDYALVSQFKWQSHLSGNAVYGRRVVTVNGVRGKVWLHRLIMQPEAHLDVDHINRDGLDNRRCNLRVCTASENLKNRAAYTWKIPTAKDRVGEQPVSPRRRGMGSGGLVYWRPDRCRFVAMAYATLPTTIFLGSFTDRELAQEALDQFLARRIQVSPEAVAAS